MRDYYYILGIDQLATEQEVKSAYRKLSIKFHPDKNDGDKYFEERFKAIQEAFETLGDLDRRSSYDFKLKNLQYSPSDANALRRMEEELRREFEEKLKYREEEIKRKYQTPEQRASEETEKRNQEKANRIKIEQEYISDEIERYKKILAEKDISLKKNKQQIIKLESEIPDIKRQIELLKSKLDAPYTDPKNDFPFTLNMNEKIGIQNELSKIKTHIHKDEQLICLNILFKYARTHSVDETLGKNYPHLLSMVLSEKIRPQPFETVYRKINDRPYQIKIFELLVSKMLIN